MNKERKLTIVASNRDRLDFKKNISKFFLKSLENQTFKNFELLIVDGGSKNFEDLRIFIEKTNVPSIRIIQEPLGKEFERAKLNNVGIRNSNTEYVMTTDVDMFFGDSFIDNVVSKLEGNTIIESRTMYWKRAHSEMVYSGKIDITDINQLRVGRIKKRTTAGGCQCAHIDKWSLVRGFDEDFVGWGSEDQDLLNRMIRAKVRPLWLGESHTSICLFHQHHHKDNVKNDLACQNVNQRMMNLAASGERPYSANPNGWGGVYKK